MNRRFFGRAGLGLFAAALTTSARAATGKSHRAVFQMSVEERRAQMGALGNVHNYAKHYKEKGEPFEVEIVAFGLGYSLVRGDMSMMKGELEALQKDLGPALQVSACHNTRLAIAESMGKKPDDIPLLPGVIETASGVVRIAELQGDGWAYLRP